VDESVGMTVQKDTNSSRYLRPCLYRHVFFRSAV